MLTTQTLTDAFNAAGVDSPEKVLGLLSIAGKQTALRTLDLQIAAVEDRHRSEQYAINQTRQAELGELKTQREAIVAQLISPAA